MYKQFIFCLLLVLCEANEENGICRKNITVTISHVVTEQKPFTVMNVTTCIKNDDDYAYSHYSDYSQYSEYDEYPVEPRTKTTVMCTKITQVMRPVTKFEQKTINKTHKFCCEGYAQVNLTSNATGELDFVCSPICYPSCKNGYCSAPQRCTCMSGYTPSFKEMVTCSPVCDLDCIHGTCVEPNTCRCDAGYELTNTTSHAICTTTILNDTACPHGFKGYDSSCKPECSDGCLNGVCISPGVCRCDPGYQEYSALGIKVCIPDCNPGYTKKDGVCRPECNQSCGKGTCVSPNVCECFHGYHVDIKQLNGDLCVPLCKGCPGKCVAPNTCVTPPLLSPFTTPVSTTSTRSTPTTLPTGISLTSTIPTRVTSIFTIIPKIKSTITIDTIEITRRPSAPPTKTTDSPITITRKPSTISTTTTPNDRSNNNKNKLSTMTSQFYKNTRHMYETSSPTIKYKYENDNKTFKEVDHTVTTNETPPTTETGRNNGPKTWLEQNWVSVLLPIAIILLAAVVMLAVWRREPIIIFLRGRSYVVEDDVPYDQDPQFQYSKKKDKVVCKCENI